MARYSFNAVGFSPVKIPHDAKYILLYDSAITGNTLQNLLTAMNQLASIGWRCISYNEYRDIERWGNIGGIKGQALMEKIESSPRLYELTESKKKTQALVVASEVELSATSSVRESLIKAGIDLSLVEIGEKNGGGFITVSPKKFLGDLWGPINEVIKVLNGKWIRQGRTSHWEIISKEQ